MRLRYLKPVDFPAPSIVKKNSAFLLNGSITESEKELHVSNRSVASQSKSKEFLEVENTRNSDLNLQVAQIA